MQLWCMMSQLISQPIGGCVGMISGSQSVQPRTNRQCPLATSVSALSRSLSQTVRGLAVTMCEPTSSQQLPGRSRSGNIACNRQTRVSYKNVSRYDIVYQGKMDPGVTSLSSPLHASRYCIKSIPPGWCLWEHPAILGRLKD